MLLSNHLGHIKVIDRRSLWCMVVDRSYNIFARQSSICLFRVLKDSQINPQRIIQQPQDVLYCVLIRIL